MGHVLGLPSGPMAAAGAVLCFGLRMAAIRYDWHLPVARTPEEPEQEARDGR